MTRLILVRHGETDWNVIGRAQGQADQPLNERGLAQAELVGRHIRENYDVGVIWSSDLSRCARTAGAVGAPVRLTETIREINFGEWEGRRWDEIRTESPEGIGRFVSGDPQFRPPGGESMSDVVIRAKRFIEETGLLKIDGDVVIVGHGGSLKCLLVVLLDLPDAAVGRFHFSNRGLSRVGVTNGSATLLTFNHPAHLDAASAPIT